MLLLVIFALPVAIGVTLYAIDWRPAGVGHGELLRPASLLNIPILKTIQGKSLDSNAWKGKWHLVLITQTGCEEACRNNLHTMRQIHVSLEKEIARLERVLLVQGPVTDGMSDLQKMYPDMPILTEASSLANQLDGKGTVGVANRLYLIDPVGNLAMIYPQGSDPNGIRKDLMKLLKYSWAG